jgi:uroporphyrinogen decarboxylase
MGVTNIIVDSDGDVSLLIPLWLEGGVTGTLPCEVKAGMDVVKLAEQFPRLQIIGGIDKHALERTTTDIDAEIQRVLPAMLKRGGYAASLDHWVQPEIPLANFEYYVASVREFRNQNKFA